MTVVFAMLEKWPEGWDKDDPPRSKSPFSASYEETMRILDNELWQLKATYPTLYVDVPEARIRRDGQLAASSKVGYPGVVLQFETPAHGTLTYACNRFGWGHVWGNGGYTRRHGWHENLRAIALGLEALRKVERYGIANRGEQYAGWAELPSGIAMPAPMTHEQALDFLRVHGGWNGLPADLESSYRRAAKELHPDAGGDPEKFRLLTQAVEVLRAA